MLPLRPDGPPDAPRDGGQVSYGPADQDALGAFLRAVWRHRLLFLGAFLGCVAIAAIALGRMTPIYTATAQVMLDSREQRILDAGAVVAESALDGAAIATAVTLINSRPLIAGVVETLDLAAGDLPADIAAPGERLTPAQIARALQGRLSVRREGASHVIAIAFDSADPEFSARVVNATADAYIESQLDERLGATRQATAWLEARTAELSADVEAAEAAVGRRRAENLALDQSGVEIANQQIADLGSRLIAARADRLGLESRHENLQRLRSEAGVAAASEILSTPVTHELRVQLLALRREANLLAARLGAGNPQLRDIEINRASIEAALAAEFDTHMAGLRSEIAIASDREQSLQDSLRELETRIVDNSHAFIELNQLQREADALRAIYETFLIRLNETRAQEAVERTNARVVSRAEPPENPSAPRRSLILAGGGVLGLLLGAGLVLLRELLRDTWRSAEEVEADLGLPVIASIPKRRGWSLQKLTRQIGAEPDSEAVEEIRRLRAALLFPPGAAPPRAVMLTSPGRGEGRTTVALALAHLCARAGKSAVILEADLRAPALARAFGWRAESDIVSVLRDGDDLDDALQRGPAGFDVLPCAPRRAGGGGDALDPTALSGLVERLAERYDIILIDAPPVLAADARAIAQITDACLYVVKAGQTRRAAARRGVVDLAGAGVFTPRIVLTMAPGKS